MKRSFVLVAMAFLLIGSFAFGEKAVLIDFSNLEPDIVYPFIFSFASILMPQRDRKSVV